MNLCLVELKLCLSLEHSSAALFDGLLDMHGGDVPVTVVTTLALVAARTVLERTLVECDLLGTKASIFARSGLDDFCQDERLRD